jgi:hypothetical protein
VGAELTIVSYTLLLPIKPMEVPIVVFSIQVETLEKLITPKLIQLVLPKIGIGT